MKGFKCCTCRIKLTSKTATISILKIGSGLCKKCKQVDSRNRYIKNIEYYKNLSKEQRKNHPRLIKKWAKEWRKKNFKRKRENWNRWYRTKASINYKIAQNIRKRIRKALQGKLKLSSTFTLLGCSISELKLYLQKQFTANMTWKNYGQWHIDHILPCSHFNLSKKSQQKICFHYSNLQPLWAKDNLSKTDKIL